MNNSIINDDDLTRIIKERDNLLDYNGKLRLHSDSSDELIKRQIEIFDGRIQRLNKDIVKYLELKETPKNTLVVSSNNDNLEEMVSSIRIANKVSIKELSEMIEIPEDKLLEMERTGYLYAEFQRVAQIVRSLGYEIVFKPVN